MSCNLCEEFQETGNSIYYRWKNANVEINACREHCLEIFEALNKAQVEFNKFKEEGVK